MSSQGQHQHIAVRERQQNRKQLFGLIVLVAAAGAALAFFGGPPRLPSGFPRPEQLATLLRGSALPIAPLAVLLLDVAWLMWLWIAGSLVLELAVLAAETVGRGARWVRSMRRIADRLSVPLVRRAVAAAFAVQVLSRTVPLAHAAPLPATDSALVAEAQPRHSIARQPTIHASEAAAAETYLVRPGDSLWSIADQAYGSGTAYKRILTANLGRRMSDGQVFTARGVIQPGWELIVPDARFAPNDDATDRWYLVQPGDTLSAIAAEHLGDEARWSELFQLNRGVLTPDGTRSLANPNVIWPGLRLQLPDDAADRLTVGDDTPAGSDAADAETDADGSSRRQTELVAASTVAAIPADVFPPTDLATISYAPSAAVPDAESAEVPPLLRTVHALEPIALEPADSAIDSTETSRATATPADEQDGAPAAPPSGELPTASLALGGASLAALAGVAAWGTRRARRLRRLPQECETEVVVEGGFAEAQLTHQLPVLHGPDFDPVTAIVGRLQHFLDGYNVTGVDLVAVRHGRSATTLTLSAALAEQGLVVDLAPEFARTLEGEADAWVSADQDVVLRLARPRKTRLLPAAAGSSSSIPCLLPLGVLYDRQTFSAAWERLGHVLIASVAGHGADTILTSLVAALTARHSPEQLRLWLIARPRSLPAPLFELPHVERAVDPDDDAALAKVAEELRLEIDARATRGTAAQLVIVVPEIMALGEHAATLELLATRGGNLGIRFIIATMAPQDAALSPLVPVCGTRMVLRMQDEETSVALLGVADAALLGGGGRLLLRLDGREPLELYGYQVAADHLERMVRVMRSSYAPATQVEPAEPVASAPGADELQPRGDAVSDEHDAAVESLADTAPVPQPEPEPSEKKPPPDANAVLQTRPAIEVICFGGPRVLCNGQQVWPTSSSGDAKPWEFLLYVACQPPEGVSRDQADETLWPQADSEDAGHRFRQVRYRLRTAIGRFMGEPADGVFLDHGTLRLDPGIVHSDATEFLGLVRTGRVTSSAPEAIAALVRARLLYQSDLLEGPDARRYAWVDERDDSGVTLREYFRKQFQQASTRLAELYVSAAELPAAIDIYRELAEIDPTDERYWRSLFRLHAARGDRSALVRAEHRMRVALRELADEEDDADGALAEPSRDLVQEYQRLLDGLRDGQRETAGV